MANNNVQNVRFLRNGSLYGTRDAALAGLNGQTLTTEQDGSIILARYGSGNDVKTIVGIIYVDGSNKSLTVIDIEGSSSDVNELRAEINAKLGDSFISSANTVEANFIALSGNSESTSAETSVEGAKKYADQKISDAISSLDYSDSAVAGEYVSQVTEADGVIAVTRIALPDASSVADDNKVVTDVTQSKGAISAVSSNITSVKLAGYSEGTDDDIAATDTLGEALGKLQAQINAMDKTASAEDGQVVTTIEEADGKVSEIKANVKDLQLGGYAKTNDTGDIASADTINVALSKLENKTASITINDEDGSINVKPVSSGTDISVKIKDGEKVLAKDGGNGIYTNLDFIKITSGLPETIKERYQLLATDNTQIGENIDIPKDSHIVSIEYSGSTQKLYYTYIDVSGETRTTEVDMSELVLETEFASGITVTDHIAHGVVDPTSESFFTIGEDGFKVAGISAHVQTEIEKLDASVSGGTIAGDASSNHIQVVVDEADGKLTAITVNEANIADKSSLDELSGKTFTVATSSNGSITTEATAASDDTVSIDLVTDASKIKMSGFTAAEGGFSAITDDSSVVDAVKTIETEVLNNEETISASLNDLNARINEISGETISQIKVNNVVLAESDKSVNVQISAAASSGAEDAAIAVNTDPSGSVTISLLGIDCGTY